MKECILPLIFIIVLMSLIGCGTMKHDGGNGQLSASKYGNLPDHIQIEDKNFKVFLEQEDFKNLTLVIENLGEQQIGFGSPYTVEKWKDEHWYVIPYKKDVGFTAIGILLKPNQKHKQSLDFKTLDKELGPGSYRVVKEIDADGVAVPFEIDKGGKVHVQ